MQSANEGIPRKLKSTWIVQSASAKSYYLQITQRSPTSTPLLRESTSQQVDTMKDYNSSRKR